MIENEGWMMEQKGRQGEREKKEEEWAEREEGRKALMQQIVMTSIDSKGYLSVEDARSP